MTNEYLIFFAAIIYTLLPAYLANMAPVLAQKLEVLPFLKKPIDGGHQLNGKDILGPGKTWRGLVVGVFVSTAVVFLQSIFQYFHFLEEIRLIDYFSLNWLLFGILAGLGALGGDIAKSFAKRRININSGDAWPVFDQLDFVLGFFLLTYTQVQWTEVIFWPALIITLAGHPITNIIGYYFKIKKVWW